MLQMLTNVTNVNKGLNLWICVAVF